MTAHCHRQVMDIAKALAGEMYEMLMGNDMFWRIWKKQNPDATRKQLEERFIERNWGRFIGEARKALVMMLKDPSISETAKDQVVDVLEKDDSLIRGRQQVVH